MHWLQTLDIGLFRFINQSLSNPFFDWLMPILSGKGVKWFIPLAVAAVIAAIGFGKTRARLCALMIFLVIALGDPLVVNTVKKTVERTRPFVTLPDARVFGKVGEGYVPSESNKPDGNIVANKAATTVCRPHTQQLVCDDNGDVPFLSAQSLVHAADGARRFLFAHLQRRSLFERRSGRRNSRRRLRRGTSNRF